MYKRQGVYTVTDVVGKVNLKLRATPQSKPILVHVNRVKHLQQSDFHEQFDSKRRDHSEDEARMSSAEENEPRRRSPPRQKRPKPAQARNSTSPKPTRFTLVMEQRQPAGEFHHYIQDAQSDSSDFRTADESPSDSTPESARPRQDSRGAAAVMHDTASAILGDRSATNGQESYQQGPSRRAPF